MPRKASWERASRGRFYREQCQQAKNAQGHQCRWCGRLTLDAVPQSNELLRTCDHVDPVTPRVAGAAAGSDHVTNLVVACHRCNDSRGNRTIREWLREQCAPPWAIAGWCCNPQARPGTSRDWYSPD